MRSRAAAVDGPVWIPDEPPSLENFLAADLQPLPLLPVVGGLLAVLYLAGALRLWLTGRHWSVTRTVVFLTGCAVLIVVMGAGIEGYGYRMFSVFMFQQLTLMMTVPPLLVLGSPGRLLLRATPHRGVGRILLRAALGALRSRGARILLHPGFTMPVFLFTFYGLYLSDLDDWLLSTWWGHQGLELLFLAAGVLFTVPLISADPLPVRLTHFGRLIDVFVEMPLHAFFGVFVMVATIPFVETLTKFPESWGLTWQSDQQIAGALAWSYGEGPTMVLLLVLLHRWYTADTARSKRADREADLHGDAELDAYNERLRRLAEQSAADGERSGRTTNDA